MPWLKEIAGRHLFNFPRPYFRFSVLTCFKPFETQSMTGKSFKDLIDPSWGAQLSSEFSAPYFSRLEKFVDRAREENPDKIYPVANKVFSWSHFCPFEEVKVVIIGQDPYPGEKNGYPYANGLAFSVSREANTIPLSLRNIFKELYNEFPGISLPLQGDLSGWAKQGVLLINSVLTVQAGEPDSHKGKGWEEFTDAVIKAVNDQKEHVVYLLWGKAAERKASRVDDKKNLVLKTSHPSPQSANQGFFGCDHFKKANEYLKGHRKSEIRWGNFS